MSVKTYPRCVRCGKGASYAYGRTVHTYRVVIGAYELFAVQLCETCGEGAIGRMDQYIEEGKGEA